MRGCATCAEFEQLLERTADDHWNVVLRRSGTPEPEQGATGMQQLRATRAAMDQALAQYKQHLETAHARTASAE